MNTFFDYIQPTIVKTTNSKEIPEHLRERYMVNFNVFGIKYFFENFLLTENEYGTPYLIMKEDKWNIILEESDHSTNETMVIDVPRIYIVISDKFLSDPNKVFQSFVYQATQQNSIYAVGIDDFMAGEDYYLNTTLYNYLANTDQITTPNFAARLPNYLDDDNDDKEPSIKTEYWEDLTQSVYNDYKNLDYYMQRNKLLENTFSEDELNNFYATFCATILKYTRISDTTRTDSTNQLYDYVLTYFSKYMSDSTATALRLVMGTQYATSTTSSTCSCSNLDSSSTSIQNCSTLYDEAMLLYLKQMLGDTQFYKDWFSIEMTETGEVLPNDVLIENLKTLINEFLSLGYDLDFSSSSDFDCSCGTVSANGNSDCNIRIINNYLAVLSYVENDEIDENTNKIKVFGEQFGEILPKLQF